MKYTYDLRLALKRLKWWQIRVNFPAKLRLR